MKIFKKYSFSRKELREHQLPGTVIISKSRKNITYDVTELLSGYPLKIEVVIKRRLINPVLSKSLKDKYKKLSKWELAEGTRKYKLRKK